ncbi:MAG: protein kinase [Sandaracinus sp.]
MTLLAGRYTLEVPLGDSDLGTVWNAHDESGRALVAITLEEDADEATKARFRAHAKALVGFHHASLVHGVAEGDTDDGAPFLVEERLSGVSLADRLEEGPALTVGRVVEIGVALAEALAEVHHAGISHGDVEPGNVLLVGEPGKEVPKLIGFGLNRASVRADIGARASMPSVGAIGYAAPEQARGEQVESALADQASLAAMIYAALGGRPPHIARDLAALAHAIGHDKPAMLTMARRDLAPFASTLDRALSSDPKKRFADIGAFGRALRTAGTMARTIAATEVPVGERACIGEPPAPALPRAATIPKPAGAARAAVPKPGAGVVPKPGAAAPRVVSSGSRTTEELDVADLQLGKSLPAPAEASTGAAAEVPSKTATPHPAPKAPSATATPHPAPKAPSATATPHPAPKAPLPPPAAPKATPAGAKPPPPAVPARGPRTTEDLDVSDLQAVAAPREEGGGELDLTKLTASGESEASGAESAGESPKTDSASGADAPKSEPSVTAEVGPASAGVETKEEKAASPPAEPAGAEDAGRISLELTAEELVSDPGPPPSPKAEHAHAEAAPPPPPHTRTEGDDHEAHAKPPAPPKHHEEAHKPPPPPSAKTDKKDEKADAAKPALAKPVVDADEPSVAFSPSMEKIVEASAKASASEGDDEPAARPAWLVPAIVVGLVAIVGIAVLAMQSSEPPPTSALSGHTLTVTTHEPPASVAADAGAATPPPTTATEPPPTTTAVPPPTSTTPPPTTRVPPATTTPPATRTPPPTTGTRPPPTGTRPPTTGTRPPTTGTRPPPTGTRPPTTGTRPPTTRTPPPSTTTRPTVVSDPGF